MRKRLVWLFALFALVLIASVCVINAYNFAFAETDEYYVICKPKSEINARKRATVQSPVVATLYFGQKVESDGKEKNDFIHVVNLPAESTSGWVYKGLLSEYEPIESTGYAQIFGAEKVAARKYGCRESQVKKWLADGQTVKIYAISERWCVTEHGYVMTEFLTVNAPVRGWKP